ncbi:hypothetical protein KFE80_09575 [bacterium SCSIO 12696]|nr:hypothetical protein KFE80_09575 [bacterium SCSIO 12696]
MESVKNWSEKNHYDYIFLGDEFFKLMTTELLEKTNRQKVIATDLARLKWMQKFLAEGYESVVWCDADFLVFCPDQFILPGTENLPEGYALGREVWVQKNQQQTGKLKAYKKVHNAFLLFRQGNHFLDFYCAHAERLLQNTTGPMPPQFIGPKLLTALHNTIQCPVVEFAGMLSPVVIQAINQGGGPAVDAMTARSSSPLYGANLCTSMAERGELNNNDMEQAIGRLLDNGIPGFK